MRLKGQRGNPDTKNGLYMSRFFLVESSFIWAPITQNQLYVQIHITVVQPQRGPRSHKPQTTFSVEVTKGTNRVDCVKPFNTCTPCKVVRISHLDRNVMWFITLLTQNGISLIETITEALKILIDALQEEEHTGTDVVSFSACAHCKRALTSQI